MRRALHTWEAFAARILAFHALRICARRALLKWRRRREERLAPTRRALGFYRRTSKRRAWRVWLQQRDVFAAWAVLRKRAMWHAAMTQRYRLLRRWRANARRLASTEMARLRSAAMAAASRKRRGMAALLDWLEERREWRQMLRTAYLHKARQGYSEWREIYLETRRRQAALRKRFAYVVKMLSLPKLRNAWLLWHSIAHKAADNERRRRQLMASLVWRGAADAFAWWRSECVAHFARRSASVLIAAKHRGGVFMAFGWWARLARTRRKIANLSRGLRKPLTRSLCGAWREWAMATKARVEAHDAATAEIIGWRLDAGWAWWVAAVDAEHAIASRLWARRVTITYEYVIRRLGRAVLIWRRRARARSDKRRWLAVGDGHYLLARKARAVRGWRDSTRRRLDAAEVNPKPPVFSPAVVAEPPPVPLPSTASYYAYAKQPTPPPAASTPSRPLRHTLEGVLPSRRCSRRRRVAWARASMSCSTRWW